MHGYNLWSKAGAPKADFSRVTLLEVESPRPFHGAQAQVDGTWVLRAALSPAATHQARNDAKRDRLEDLAGSIGLTVTEREVSRTWVDMVGLL